MAGKNKEKKIKLPIRKTISDNIFMLKLLHKSSPFLVASCLIVALLDAVCSFVSDTFLLRFALNGINENRTFFEIATVIAVWLIVRLAVISIVNLYYRLYYDIKITDVKKDVHSIVYSKATTVDLACYEDPSYYDEFVKAIDECSTRSESVINSLTNIIYTIVRFITNFTLVVIIDPVLLFFSLIPLITIPLQTKLNKANYNKEMELKEENRRKDYSRRTFYLADYSKEMRLTDMSSLMLVRFRESGAKVIGLLHKHGIKIGVLDYLITVCNEVVTTLGATLYAVWQTFVTGKIGYGDCIVIINSIENISYTLTYTTDDLLLFQENALYIENLRKFLDYTPKITDGDKALPESGDIVLKDVCFKYEGASDYTLKNISMSFGKQEKIAIVGHNGAGKTTLVKLLLRLYDCEGSITYGGEEIRDLCIDEYRNIFSAVMQDFHTFALTTAENVLLRKRTPDDDEIIKNALQQSGLFEKVEKFEKGIDTVMTKEFDEKGELLSIGQQQKLAISHVYSKDNRFVILDEPSSALDPIAEYEMYNQMNDACKDCAMIFISHRLSSAVMADRIYLMEKGEISEVGTHKELMNLNGKYADMFRKQAQNYAEVDV